MSAPATALAPAPPAERAGRRHRLALVVMGLGVSLVVVDSTIAGVLTPRLVTELGLTTSGAEWVSSIYPIMFAALLIPLGRAGDLLGRRRVFVAGVAVFTVAGLLAALAHSGTTLIAARALQGVGASMIMPATLATMNAVFTGRRRAMAFGIWGSLVGGMAALGPLLGGAVATSVGWRWAFGVNVPLGVLLIAGALAVMPETRQVGGGGIDRLGAALAVPALGALTFGLIEGPHHGWWEPLKPLTAGPYTWPEGLSPVPVALSLGIVLLGVLTVVERTRAAAGRPVTLDPALLKIPAFRRGSLTAALISVGELGLVFVLPLFLTGAHGTSPLHISAAIMPLALGAFVAGPAAGRLAGRWGAHQVVRLGLALEVAAVAAIGLTLTATTGGWGLAPWMLLYGVGLGLASSQLTSVCLAEVPPARAGQASGMQSTARQVGAALGIAFVGAVFATGLGREMAARLEHTPLPAQRQAAVVHSLRESAGTYAHDLSRTPGAEVEARAARESLAAATRQAMAATAGILALGLVMSLRLRPAATPPRKETDPMSTSTSMQTGV